ncbi:type II toxin-antitoxin system RelE/ParE family toxin [Edwardsiella ictaluri]|nr:type II toxin-antitoxin system RelE/ParE family toxin [Edwardsiella ictaluri]UCQ46305.1 type II toxin-antitoxin system RelE/ParE family toxin [Edwardsiella ictaluri]UYB60298.1 type II toxin-antitoxin system RelE/ParE family toxin [Edwardsiella ictaluri]UYB63524.1 type II toxin-antitoxin system RelE/ParE family toxin [Edwardsiella ictaluri]WFO09791.1 type II toxin-antitoxin system RelE/ParE family toxin [Edwardsiella ictaluri]WFO12702.1 type II toxin-antitoxin system RelE/ParE family toxin [
MGKNLRKHNNIVMFHSMNYTIEYYSEEVRLEVDQLPMGMRVRYQHLVERMEIYGSNLGEPHTSPFGDGLFELRIKGSDGIARVFYCTLTGKRIVMLHSFIKKTQKTPSAERKKAETRMKEVKHGW